MDIRSKSFNQIQTQERGKEKREPVRMTKNFDFQTPVIYVVFKLTILVASTTTTANWSLGPRRPSDQSDATVTGCLCM